MKKILFDILPWILYSVIAGSSPKQLDLAIAAALIAFIFFNLRDVKNGFILSWGTLVFFTFMLISVVVFKNAWVVRHTWVISNGTLALIAWGSLFVGKPFTIQYARLQVSKDKWNHPLFIRINQLVTMAWGFLFLVDTVGHILQLYYPLSYHWVYETIFNGTTMIGVWFTTWFPSWYRQRVSNNKEEIHVEH